MSSIDLYASFRKLEFFPSRGGDWGVLRHFTWFVVTSAGSAIERKTSENLPNQQICLVRCTIAIRYHRQSVTARDQFYKAHDMFASHFKNIIIALIIVYSLPVTASAGDLVPWTESLGQAQQLAKMSNKLIVVHFWDDNCPPCRFLEQEVYSQPIFGHTLSQHYIPVKIKVSASPDIARHFQVSQWPTDVMLRPDGEVLHRMVSPRKINEYLRILTEVAWRSSDSLRTAGIDSPGYADGQQPANSVSGMGGHQGMQLQMELERVRKQEQSMQNQFAIKTPSAASSSDGAPGSSDVVPGASAATSSPVVPGQAHGRTASKMPKVEEFKDFVIPAEGPRGKQIVDTLEPRVINNQFVQANESHPAASPVLTQETATRNADAPMLVENKFIGAKSDETTMDATNTNRLLSKQMNALTQRANTTTQPAISQAAAMQGNADKQILAHTASNVADSATGDAQTKLHSGLNPAAGPSLSRPASRSHASYTIGPLPPNSSVESEPSIQLAMDGYCPVALLDREDWVRGDRRWGAHHRGQTYLFHSAAAQQRFLSDPDRFSPALAGFDPIVFVEQNRYEMGERAHGVRYKGQMFLFETEQNLKKFWSAPWKYSQVVHQAMGTGQTIRR